MVLAWGISLLETIAEYCGDLSRATVRDSLLK